MTRGFEVFRMEKLKTEGAVLRAVRHDLDMSYENDKGEEVFYRKTRDEEREHLNQYCYKYWTDKDGQKHERSKEERLQLAMKNFRKRLPDKIRKNAVVGAQAICTFSHELLQDKNFKFMQYFADCQKFVNDSFGADNVFNWALHLDEKTPHITFQFVPKDEKGRLNARKIFGNKKTLSEWQDRFHEEVGKKYGLQRGVKKTNQIHETLNRFYGKLKNLDEDLDRLQLDKKPLGESWEDYFSRTKQELKSFVEPMLRPLASLRQQVAKLEKQQENFESEKALFAAQQIGEKQALERDRRALERAQQAFDDKLSTEVEKRVSELIPSIRQELEKMYVPKDLKFTKGDKTVNFFKRPYSELAKELADFYLDDEPKVHERKKEIEREFSRNKVRTY